MSTSTEHELAVGISRLVWIADLLPDTLADLVSGFMEHGCTAITRTLERAE